MANKRRAKGFDYHARDPKPDPVPELEKPAAPVRRRRTTTARK